MFDMIKWIFKYEFKLFILILFLIFVWWLGGSVLIAYAYLESGNNYFIPLFIFWFFYYGYKSVRIFI